MQIGHRERKLKSSIKNSNEECDTKATISTTISNRNFDDEFESKFEKSNRSRRIRNSRDLTREVELREVEFDDRFREVE